MGVQDRALKLYPDEKVLTYKLRSPIPASLADPHENIMAQGQGAGQIL